MVIAAPAVATPYPRITATATNADERVVVVLTQARIDRAHRAEFDRLTELVLATLPTQPGLLGYSVRRQLAGDAVWTLTIWVSGEARARFLESPAHRRAVAHSGPAVRSMRSWRAILARKHIPASWAEALAMLATPDGTSNPGGDVVSRCVVAGTDRWT